MKRVLFGALFAFVIVLGVMLARTLMVSEPQEVKAKAERIEIDANIAANHLAEAVRFQTISYDNKIKADEKNEQLRAMRTWLEKTYPAFHKSAQREVIGESLLFTWTGKDPKLNPVLLMAHMDVVPIAPGTEKDWTHLPFSGDIADGFVWGRGTIDDKGSLIGLLEGAEKLAASGFRPARTIMFAFGQDEEVGGVEGNAQIAKTLKTRDVHLEWVLDEGGLVRTQSVPGLEQPIAFVSVAEKGYLTVDLIAHGPGGHSSRPSDDLTIARLATAILNVLNNPFPSALNEVHYRQFESLLPMLPFWEKFILSNLWLTSPFVTKMMASNPETASELHTTIAPTMLSGGIKDNVLPQSATATINLRIGLGDTIANAVEHLKYAINDPKVDVVERKVGSQEPSPVSNMESDSYQFLRKTIEESLGFPVAPLLLFGSTDSKHFVPIATNTFRFIPVLLEPTDMARFHGTNERLAVTEIGKMCAFYYRLMRDMK